MLSNQTFRDVYKADNLNIDQRLKITSLSFLFTDLKGSTALYERVGDLAARSIWCARISTRCWRSSPRRRARW
jgi:class 3 adenylate cyclase